MCDNYILLLTNILMFIDFWENSIVVMEKSCPPPSLPFSRKFQSVLM